MSTQTYTYPEPNTTLNIRILANIPPPNPSNGSALGTPASLAAKSPSSPPTPDQGKTTLALSPSPHTSLAVNPSPTSPP